MVALHGFMGHPSDFNVLNVALKAPHIFSTQICSMEQWAKRFNRFVAPKNIMLGYSMGGRLALHCLLDNPNLYQAAIIVAAHAGIRDEERRYMRLEQDRIWSTKFKFLPWPQLIEEWENAPALKGSKKIERREADYDRASLAMAMRSFSLGSQSYLIPQINEITIPILWLSRQQELANIDGLHLKHPLSQHCSINGSHRFIFERPKLIEKMIRNFISKL